MATASITAVQVILVVIAAAIDCAHVGQPDCPQAALAGSLHALRSGSRLPSLERDAKNEMAMPFYMEPQWFLPLFAIMWFSICALLSRISGWSSLAKRHHATQPESGEISNKIVRGHGWHAIYVLVCAAV